MSYITGIGLTSYGKHEGLTSLDLMSKAAGIRCRPQAQRNRRRALRLFHGVAAHHAGDRVRRAFRHQAGLRRSATARFAQFAGRLVPYFEK
jgi:hypothetical protein